MTVNSLETLNLLRLGDIYGDGASNVDLRFAKVLRLGKTRTNVGIDLYNVFNSNTASACQEVGIDPQEYDREYCSETGTRPGSGRSPLCSQSPIVRAACACPQHPQAHR